MVNTVGFSQAGTLQVNFNNAYQAQAGATGLITGSGVMELTKTQGKNSESVISLTQSDPSNSLSVYTGLVGGNYLFNGSNININANAGNAIMNVTMNTADSTYDRSQSSATTVLTTTGSSSNNAIALGAGADVAVLGGKYNYLTGVDGQKTVTTTSDSFGNVVVAGGGAWNMNIDGKFGAFYGGNADVNFNSSASSNRNVMIGGNGDNVVNDYGNTNFYLGNTGKNSSNTVNSFGSYFVANMVGATAPSTTLAGTGARVFTAYDQKDSNGVAYNYWSTLANSSYNWSFENFVGSTGANLPENSYANMAFSNVIAPKLQPALTMPAAVK